MNRMVWLMAIALCGCTSMQTRDCAQCPEMVVIPAGTVISRPFAVSRYEITRDQYEAFVRATNRPVGGDCLTDRRKRGDWQIDAVTTFRDPGFAQTGDQPVACVNWDEAQAYVAWLNTRTQGGYRLLTEVEWQYVARGGATQNLIYPWGDGQAQGCPFANLFDHTTLQTYAGIDTSGYKVFDPMDCADGRLNTSPVGSLAHNARIAERVPYPPAHRDDSIGIRVAKTLR